MRARLVNNTQHTLKFTYMFHVSVCVCGVRSRVWSRMCVCVYIVWWDQKAAAAKCKWALYYAIQTAFATIRESASFAVFSVVDEPSSETVHPPRPRSEREPYFKQSTKSDVYTPKASQSQSRVARVRISIALSPPKTSDVDAIVTSLRTIVCCLCTLGCLWCCVSCVFKICVHFHHSQRRAQSRSVNLAIQMPFIHTGGDFDIVLTLCSRVCRERVFFSSMFGVKPNARERARVKHMQILQLHGMRGTRRYMCLIVFTQKCSAVCILFWSWYKKMYICSLVIVYRINVSTPRVTCREVRIHWSNWYWCQWIAECGKNVVDHLMPDSTTDI